MKKENDDIIKKEIKENAPELSKFSKQNPFEVPENYFQELNKNIKDNITSEKSSKIIPLRTRKILAYAASIAIIITLGFYSFIMLQKDDTNIFADANDELIEFYFTYLIENDEISYFDIVDLEENDYFESSEYLFKNEYIDKISDDAFMEYLIDYMDTYYYSFEEISATNSNHYVFNNNN